MKNLLNQIFSSSRSKPPRIVLKTFNARFGSSVNVEWHPHKLGYEALFYIREQEQLALFSPEGMLLEKKSNLFLNEVTPPIGEATGRIGELMNLIRIERDDQILYEVIARNTHLERFYLLLDEGGKVLGERKL